MSEKYDYDQLDDERITIIPPGADVAGGEEGGQAHPAEGSGRATFSRTFCVQIEVRSAVVAQTEDGSTGRREFTYERILTAVMREETTVVGIILATSSV